MQQSIAGFAWRDGGHVDDQERQHFSSLGTKLYFHVSFRKIKFSIVTTNMTAVLHVCIPRTKLSGEKKGEFFGGKGLIREFSLFMFNSLQTPKRTELKRKEKNFTLTLPSSKPIATCRPSLLKLMLVILHACGSLCARNLVFSPSYI